MRKLIVADVKSYNKSGRLLGHYLPVAQNYMELYNSYCSVIIAGGQIFGKYFKKDSYMPLPYEFVDSNNWFRNKLHVLMNCKYLFCCVSYEDVIVIQQSGLLTAILGIALFAKKKSNIYIISYDTDVISSFVGRMIYKWAKPKLKGVLCSHRHVAEAYKIASCIVPDYIYSKDSLCEFGQLQDKRYDIAIVGGIVPDKGVVEAAKYLVRTNHKVLIAGMADEQTSAELNEICSASQNVELRLGFISEGDFCTYIRDSRFCMLNYHGTYEDRSSGVALDILFNGTPIIGHRCKALNFIEEENMGYLYNSMDDIDWNVLKDIQRYKAYQQSISNYLLKQKRYRQNVMDFLGIKK